MHFDFLSAASVWLTYLIQVACAYLITWVLCRFISNTRIRLRLWSAFLALAVAGWLLKFADGISSGIRAQHAHILGSGAGATASLLHWSLPVETSWTNYFSRFLPWTGWLYAAIVSALLVQFCIKWWQLRRLLRSSQKPSCELDSVFQRLCREMRAPSCELRVLPELRSPAAACWWRPRVLLPSELAPQIEAQQLTDVLRHELIHVRRRDYLWDRIAALACRFVFFHPAVWLAYRRLRWERELVCDQAVVEHRGEQRLQYANCLTTLARQWFLGKEASAAIDFASAPSLLSARVHALLREPSSHPRLQKTGAAGMILCALTLTLWLVPGLEFMLYRSSHESTATEAYASSLSTQINPILSKAIQPRMDQIQPKLGHAQAKIDIAKFDREERPIATYTKPSTRLQNQLASKASLDPEIEYDGATRQNESSVEVWKESPVSTNQPTTPTWQDAVGTVITGVALSRREKTDSGQQPSTSGEQPAQTEPSDGPN